MRRLYLSNEHLVSNYCLVCCLDLRNPICVPCGGGLTGSRLRWGLASRLRERRSCLSCSPSIRYFHPKCAFLFCYFIFLQSFEKRFETMMRTIQKIIIFMLIVKFQTRLGLARRFSCASRTAPFAWPPSRIDLSSAFPTPRLTMAGGSIDPSCCLSTFSAALCPRCAPTLPAPPKHPSILLKDRSEVLVVCA